MTFQKKYAIILRHVGVWLSLVERLVRDSITVLCVVNSKNAENP